MGNTSTQPHPQQPTQNLQLLQANGAPSQRMQQAIRQSYSWHIQIYPLQKTLINKPTVFSYFRQFHGRLIDHARPSSIQPCVHEPDGHVAQSVRLRATTAHASAGLANAADSAV